MTSTFSLLTAALLVAQNPAPTPTAPAAPAATCPCQKNNNNVSQVQYVAPVPADVAASSGSSTVSNDNHPILNRIRGWFRGKDATVETSAPVMSSEPPTEQKRAWFRMPTASSTPTTTTAPTYVTPTAAPMPSPNIQTIPTSPAAPLAPVVQPSALPPAAVRIVTPTSATTTMAIPANTTVNASMIATPGAATAMVATSNRPSKISPELVNKVGHDENFTWITGQIRIENGVHVLHYATPETVDRFGGFVVLTSDRDLRSVPDGAYVCVRGGVAQQTPGRTMYRVQALDILAAR